MKTIGIDYRLGYSSFRGMGRYVREIVKELQSIDSINQYILFIDSSDPIGEPIKLNSNFKYVTIDVNNYMLFEQVYLPKEVRKNQLDIMWCPYNTAPFFMSNKSKLFLTIHDLIFMDKSIPNSKSLYQYFGKIYRSICLKLISSKISKCFTVSEYSQKDIHKLLGIENIKVTYNKVDKLESSVQTTVLKKYGLEDNGYYFTVSGDAPSKNLKRVIDAYSMIRKSDKKLVVTGIKNPKDSYIYTYCQENIIDVIFTEYITDDELLDLYKHNYAFLFLSLAEGFGIPLIEAMNFDNEIITSNTYCIPEIVGKTCSIINPYSVDDIYSAMISLKGRINKDERAERDKILDKFSSWRDTALIIYNDFMEVS